MKQITCQPDMAGKPGKMPVPEGELFQNVCALLTFETAKNTASGRSGQAESDRTGKTPPFLEGKPGKKRVF